PRRSIWVPQASLARLPGRVSLPGVDLKGSSLGSIITYYELLRAALLFGVGNWYILQSLVLAAVIFIVINWLLTLVARWLSRFLSGRTAGATTTGPGIGNPTVVAGGPAEDAPAEAAAR